jgi:hypothetical protein
VRLSADWVTVETAGLGVSHRWQAPVAQFAGVTHHIRATLSGARHEIILVHPSRDKDVLLAISARPPAQGVDHYAGLLGIGVVPASVLYGRRAIRPAAATLPPVDVQHHLPLAA